MRTEKIPLAHLSAGIEPTLTVHRFGSAGARPRIYVQASLHADEIPGMIAAHHLREQLTRVEAEGRIRGEVILVPSANPIGLAQRVLGSAIGRFDLADGVNFNRDYPYLVPPVKDRVSGRLGGDPEANVRIIREALAAELAGWRANTPAEQLKKILVGLAIEADVILDLHCDAEAVMHLYTLTPSAEAFQPLCSLLGCQAILLAAESGGNPFDEVSSRPWLDLRQAFPDHPIPDGCIACTVELRGERDVDRGTALADAAALVDYMIVLGVIEGQKPAIPEPLCRPTPLEGSEPVTAPAGGIVVFHAKPGDRVAAGDVIAEIIDPLTGATVAARTASDGVLYARIGTRFARAGERLAKVAGTTLHRSGKLLSA